MKINGSEMQVAVMAGLLIVAVLLTGYNAITLTQLSSAAPNAVGFALSAQIQASGQEPVAGASTSVQQAQVIQSVSFADIAPKGVPAVYGTELVVSYDDISASNPTKADDTIKKLGALDEQITLNATQKQRYVNILYNMSYGMSCEYCCGARSIIFENGEPACGCAHSYAMRGVTKYLLTKHASEFTDEQIQEEIGKWKTLFFPGPIANKASILKDNGIKLDYINMTSNKFRGVEARVASAAAANSGTSASAVSGGGPAQVGGC